MNNDCVGSPPASTETHSRKIRIDAHEMNNCLLAIQLGMAEIRDQLMEGQHDLCALNGVEAALEETKALLNASSIG